MPNGGSPILFPLHSILQAPPWNTPEGGAEISYHHDHAAEILTGTHTLIKPVASLLWNEFSRISVETVEEGLRQKEPIQTILEWGRNNFI